MKSKEGNTFICQDPKQALFKKDKDQLPEKEEEK